MSDPLTKQQCIENEEYRERRRRDADEAPKLRNNLMIWTAENNRLAREIADRDAEIARLKAALDSESTLRSYREEQLRLLHQDYAGCGGERNKAIVERDNADAAVTAYQHEVESRDTQIANLTGWLDAAKAEASQARHEVETWQREYSGALADFEHAQAATARLKAELAEAQAGVTERQKTIDVMLENRKRDHAAIAAWVDDLHAGRISTRIEPAPPADDPRIAALCRVVTALADLHCSRLRDELGSVGLSDDLETIAGRR